MLRNREELNEAKTTIVSVKKGFDFLGYNFRIYPYDRRPTGYIALTKPTKKRVQRIIAKIRKVANRCTDAGILVYRLNPILRGWANYYSCVVAKRTASLDVSAITCGLSYGNGQPKSIARGAEQSERDP